MATFFSLFALSVLFALPFSPLLIHCSLVHFTRPLFHHTARILFGWRDSLNIATMYLFSIAMRNKGIHVLIESNRSVSRAPCWYFRSNGQILSRGRGGEWHMHTIHSHWCVNTPLTHTDASVVCLCFFACKVKKIRFVSYINYRLMQMRRQFRFNVALNEEKKIEESNKAIDRSTNTRGHTHTYWERARARKKRNGYF